MIAKQCEQRQDRGASNAKIQSMHPRILRHQISPLATYIANGKTKEDWQKIRKLLLSGDVNHVWETAYSDFYLSRLQTRYLEPINLLQDHGKYQGEGFAIVTIQCSLVEFLESTIQGVSYRYLGRGCTLGPYEYSSSKYLFVSFLTTREPFKQHFDTPTAMTFYEDIRCGLLHEARTKGQWRIWGYSADAKLIDKTRKIIFRDNLQLAFQQFIECYRGDLLREPDLKSAFIRKFDSLCTD